LSREALTLVTPAPTSSTMPAASWPSTMGSGDVQSPFMMCQPLWQMPAALAIASALRGTATLAFEYFASPGQLVALAPEGRQTVSARP